MVPSGWELKKLSDICSINPKKPVRPIDGKVSFIPMANISESGKVIKLEERHYDEVSKGFTSFIDNDVIVAKITPCFENEKGAFVSGLKNGIGFGSTEFHVFRANKATCSEFIYYLTRTKELLVKGKMNMQGSAGHRRVTADYFHTYKVKTPPLPEQQRIAKILSTWDKAISTTEALIDNSKQQKKALMQQLLTGKKRFAGFEGEWEEVKLDSVLSLMRSGLSRKLENDNIGIAVLRSNNMNAKYTNNIGLKYWYLDDPQGAKVDNYILDEGDLLVNFINSLSQIGKASIYRKIGNVDAIYTTNILRIKANQKLIHSVFLYLLTQTERYDSYIKSITKPAVNQASFTTKEFGGFTIELPALEEQQKIASVLTNADKEIEHLEQQLADFKQEKKALMQQLLTGKRRVEINNMEKIV